MRTLSWVLPLRNSFTALPGSEFFCPAENFCAFQLPTLPDQSLHVSRESIFSPPAALKYLSIFNSEYRPILAVAFISWEIVTTDTSLQRIFRRIWGWVEDVNRPEISWKTAGFEGRQGGNTSCDSFMSNLVLLLINIFTGSVPWEEHCPWVRREFILVNNSWALLIHFSTGSKTITLVLLWFGKEKAHRITKAG